MSDVLFPRVKKNYVYGFSFYLMILNCSLKGVAATNYPRRIPFGLDSPSDDLVNAKQESHNDSFQENGRGNRE